MPLQRGTTTHLRIIYCEEAIAMNHIILSLWIKYIPTLCLQGKCGRDVLTIQLLTGLLYFSPLFQLFSICPCTNNHIPRLEEVFCLPFILFFSLFTSHRVCLTCGYSCWCLWMDAFVPDLNRITEKARWDFWKSPLSPFPNQSEHVCYQLSTRSPWEIKTYRGLGKMRSGREIRRALHAHTREGQGTVCRLGYADPVSAYSQR